MPTKSETAAKDAAAKEAEAQQAQAAQDAPSQEDATKGAIELLLSGAGQNDPLRPDLEAEAKEQYKAGMTAEQLAAAVTDARSAARSNSDPRTWPAVTGQPAPETVNLAGTLESQGGSSTPTTGVGSTQMPSFQDQQDKPAPSPEK